MLWVPDEPCTEKLFELVEDPTVHEGMPYDLLNKCVVEHGVRPGFLCLDADRPIFKVTILRCNMDSFVLTMSLSHAIADGDTFYQIYRMLDTSQPIEVLQPTRVQAFTAMAREKVGPAIQDWKVSKRTSFSYALKHYYAGYGYSRKFAALYTVDPDWLVNEKQLQRAACEAREFLSSNDILTTEIFKLCDVDFGSMMVNLRNRLEGISSDLAGNYCDSLGFFREDLCKGPVAIRRALNGAEPRDFQPSLLQTVGMRFGTVTSWASFHRDLELDGCQVGEHFPVFDPMGVPRNTATIYSPRKGCLGVMIVAGRKTHEAFKHHVGFQEHMLSKVLETQALPK
jgi:hypothetical protein